MRLLTCSALLLRNPHSFLHIEAPDATGKMQTWAIEWSGAAALRQTSVGRDTFKAGDAVSITANPARDHTEFKARMVVFKRHSDGMTWGQAPGQVVD